MPPPFEEWWKGHTLLPLLPLSVHPCVRLPPALAIYIYVFFQAGHPCPLDTFLVNDNITGLSLWIDSEEAGYFVTSLSRCPLFIVSLLVYK